jgi:hypothetical protein
MNSSVLYANLGRFLLVLAIQGLLLQQVALSVGEYFNILIYPLFIFLLPIQLATPYLVGLGFLIGICVDFFYQSPGVHASAGVFSGWARAFIFKVFAPKGGFSGKESTFSPAYFGWQMYLQTLAVFMVVHAFWYFSVDAFTFVYFGSIAMKTLASWILSMAFAGLVTGLIHPKN